MTEKELAEIEARAEAATEGPWYSPDATWRVYNRRCLGVCKMTNDDEYYRKVDSLFIQGARQDIPTLCAELRKAWERIKELETRQQETVATITGAVLSRLG